MGYLDNSTIVVDAVLPKEGRKRLAQGQGLDIQYFTLSDSGIDYRLWNPDHPSGSAYYGEAIENLPSLEAIPRGEFYLRNKLVTLNQSVTGLPYWEVGGSTDFQTIVLNGQEDPETNGVYEGVEVQFKLNQTTAGQCMLIIGDVSAVQSVSAGATSNFQLNYTTDPDGVNYNTLVNIEAHTPGYWTFTPGNSTFYLNFKRPDSAVQVVTNCMLVDISTGIYRTFQLDVSGTTND